MSEPATNIAVIDPPKRGQAIITVDPVQILDTAKFEQMQRVASVMARMTIVPESLVCKRTGSGQNATYEPLPYDAAMANCFLVVNQAVRWGMDPFAVAQCASVVHGRLMWEGKLVAAVIEQKLGIRLQYAISGTGEAMKVVVSGRFSDEAEPRTVSGTVADWKTTGNNSPWSPKNYARMLHYRGAREWARLHAPAVMLGVYTDDEMEALNDHQPQPAPRRAPPPPPAVTGPRRAPPPPVAKAEQPAPAPAVEAEDTSFVEFAEGQVTTSFDLLQMLEDELAACTNGEAYDDVSEAWNERIGNMPPADRARALELKEKHGERLS